MLLRLLNMLIFHSFLMFFVCLPEGKYLEIAVWSSWSDGPETGQCANWNITMNWMGKSTISMGFRDRWIMMSWCHEIWIMILLMVKQNPINHQADGFSKHPLKPFLNRGISYMDQQPFSTGAGCWVDLAPLFRAASDFRCDLVQDRWFSKRYSDRVWLYNAV